MPFLTSGLVAGVALLILIVVAVRVNRARRGVVQAVRLARAALSEQARLLIARSAALRVELARRRGRPGTTA